LRGAGFLKIEIRDENCALTVQISGAQPAGDCTGQVYGLWENREEVLGNILFQGGRGSKELRFERGKADSPGYEGLQAIRIPLGGDSELYCQIKKPGLTSVGNEAEGIPVVRKMPEEPMPAEMAAEEEPVVAEEPVGPVPVEMAAEEAPVVAEEPVGPVPAEMAAEEAPVVAEAPGGPMPAEMAAEEAPVVAEEPGESMSAEAPLLQPRRMLEEKWEQLWGVYPHRRPFRDEREYLQIGPEDFVILRDRFYKLVHNSFLLHGFYNYQHLILSRLERRGENFYYVGVPGNFYDREKQVAVMYGFESFECAKEPAGPGDFGYYMIRVEL